MLKTGLCIFAIVLIVAYVLWPQDIALRYRMQGYCTDAFADTIQQNMCTEKTMADYLSMAPRCHAQKCDEVIVKSIAENVIAQMKTSRSTP